jgi:hypothetical protein
MNAGRAPTAGWNSDPLKICQPALARAALNRDSCSPWLSRSWPWPYVLRPRKGGGLDGRRKNPHKVRQRHYGEDYPSHKSSRPPAQVFIQDSTQGGRSVANLQ